MPYPANETLTDDLLELLGLDNFICLVEAYGGLRQYIPHDMDKSDMTKVVGETIMQVLCQRYAGAVLRIPLARSVRARHYRLSGVSDRDIARKLGITETAVEKLFRRSPTKRPPRQRKTDPRQIDMFS